MGESISYESTIQASTARMAACPVHAVSSDLTRLRLDGAGGFPGQERVPRLARAVPTRAHTPARPALTPPALQRSDRTGAGPAATIQGGGIRYRRQADPLPSAAGSRRG